MQQTCNNLGSRDRGVRRWMACGGSGGLSARRVGWSARTGRGGRGCGFTLIELLIVVAVVSLLIGILLPAVGSAVRSARSAACLSNLRQLAMAQVMYADDHDGRLVRFGMAHGGAPLDLERSWYVSLQDYVDEPLALRSPLDNSPFWPVEEGGSGEVVTGSGVEGRRATSYGLNDLVAGTPIITAAGRVLEFNRLDRIRQASHTVQWVSMAYDSEFEFFGEFALSDHVHPLDWWIEGSAAEGVFIASEMVQISSVRGSQNEWSAKSNYAFLDGHVSTLGFQKVWERADRNWFDPRVAR